MPTLKSSKLGTTLLTVFLVSSLLAGSLFAQRGRDQGDRGGRGGRGGKGGGGGAAFGVEMILDRLDTNKNKILEPAEMKGRTQQFVQSAGLDPNRPHSIATIAAILNNKDKQNQNQNGNDAAAGTEANRKIPGFGVDVELVGIKDFSPSGEERLSAEGMQRKFGDNIMAQVEQTLRRYDVNKSGILESNEIHPSHWTNPSSNESDTNKDGSLTRLELAHRYKDREDAAKNRNQAGNNRTGRTPVANAVATPGTNSFRRPVPVNRGGITPVSNDNSNRQGFNSGSDAYSRYAEGLLKTYDKDKDQRLSKSELDEMRRPPKDADSNRDGYVDKNELITSVSGGAKSGSSEQASSGRLDRRGRSGRTDGSDSLTNLRRAENVSYNQADSIFGGRDLNNDRQLQMSEFAQEWNDQTVAEFVEKDRNGDGVITEKEWTSAS